MKEGEGIIYDEKIDGPLKKPQEEPQKVELLITYFPKEGKLSVSGGIMGDLIASLGMLENAKAVIFQYQATKHTKGIQIPKHGIIDYVKTMGKKRF